MKFCTECGNRLSDGAKFCESCGTRVVGATGNGSSAKVAAESCVKSHIPHISEENLHMMLEDGQIERITSKFESLKEDSDCERIHIVGERDFDDLVGTFRAILKKRGVDGDVVEAAGPMAIALIDNSKSGLGKRGTLITRFGLIVLDQDVPNFEDDSEKEGVIPWKLFAYFSAPYDQGNFRLLDLKKLFLAEEVDDEIKSEIKKGEADLMLRFERTGLNDAQIKDLMEFLKSIVIDGVTNEVEDEDEDEEVKVRDKGLANEEAQLEEEFEDEDIDETGFGEDDDID